MSKRPTTTHSYFKVTDTGFPRITSISMHGTNHFQNDKTRQKNKVDDNNDDKNHKKTVCVMKLKPSSAFSAHQAQRKKNARVLAFICARNDLMMMKTKQIPVNKSTESNHQQESSCCDLFISSCFVT